MDAWAYTQTACLRMKQATAASLRMKEAMAACHTCADTVQRLHPDSRSSTLEASSPLIASQIHNQNCFIVSDWDAVLALSNGLAHPR